MRAELTFSAAGATLHCPMVAAVVAGVPTLLVVDTGATAHVLTLDLVRRAGLRPVAGEPGRDGSGAAVDSWDVGQVEVEIGGSRLSFAETAAIAGPPPFTGWGVGGILSPQRLAPARTVVLDLRAGSLALTDEGIGSPPPGLVPVRAHRHAAGTIGVVATIDRFGTHLGFLDTGAAASEVVGTHEGERTHTGAAVGGGRSEAVVVAGAELLLGAALRRVPALQVVDALAPPDGAPPGEVPSALLAMDVLEGSVLVIPPPPAEIAWFVRSDEPAPR